MRRQAHCAFWGVIRGEIHGGRCLSRAEPPSLGKSFWEARNRFFKKGSAKAAKVDHSTE